MWNQPWSTLLQPHLWNMFLNSKHYTSTCTRTCSSHNYTSAHNTSYGSPTNNIHTYAQPTLWKLMSFARVSFLCERLVGMLVNSRSEEKSAVLYNCLRQIRELHTLNCCKLMWRGGRSTFFLFRCSSARSSFALSLCHFPFVQWVAASAIGSSFMIL